MVKVKNADEIRNLIINHPLEYRRIFSIAAHIDHGKSTTADYLLRRAGLMSDKAAGQARGTDYDEEEQERGITIFTSVVILAYEFEGQLYIFQINDTPGHISFTGEVSRALRGSDGAVILVDALEGVMTQTETNIRLAVGEEACKPTLFINKVDRLISELRLKPQEVQGKLETIIKQVNNLIRRVAPDEFKKEWTVTLNNDSIAIGSAKDGWAFTLSILKEKGVNFTKVFEKYAEGDVQWLRENLPLDDAILRMVIKNLPSPKEAQKWKIKRIWKGDLNSEAGKALMNCDPNGPLLGMITKVFVDPKSRRPILIGRVFSGTLKSDDTIYLLGKRQKHRLKRLGVMEITDLLDVPKIPAGNLFAAFGFICPAGESFTREGTDIEGFEEISYAAEPVVSVTIIPKNPQDVAKLGDVVNLWIAADPTAQFVFDNETKRYILSGIDPLQIQILTTRINEQIPIDVEDPIIVHRETVTKKGVEIHTKSPNGHNRLLLYVEPLDKATVELLKRKEITEDMDRKEMARILADKAGWDAKSGRNVWAINDTNILVDMTRGVQRLERIQEFIIQTWKDFTRKGSLAGEPVMNTKWVILDATVHTDPAHTGLSEILAMTNAACNITFLTAGPKLYEPILQIDIKAPAEYLGEISKILNQHRGMILDTIQEDYAIRVKGKIPTSETLNLADEIRAATSGRGFFGYEFLGFEEVPPYLVDKKIAEIRQRNGLPPEVPKPEQWQRFVYVRTG